MSSVPEPKASPPYAEEGVPPIIADPRSLRSLLRALRRTVRERLEGLDDEEIAAFLRRFDRYAPDVCWLAGTLYGERDDFTRHLEAIFTTAAEAYRARSPELKALDARREADPGWYQHHAMVGGVCYADLFAGTLKGVQERIPYFKELGLTYLHLMPLFRTPEGPNDGGYAVSSYREVNPRLGTMDDLRNLSAALRAEGISLVLDFVFNHTASDHEWALRARAGDPHYQQYYYMFDDRSIPDAYEKTLREIFPEEHQGAFTFFEEIGKWVWTTFHTYQWDLNYSNPAVFRQMLEEMLFLANVGAEVLRLDAVAFVWKQMGTPCENLPQAHTIIRAFNALVRIAAPALIFKSEAIVHPDDVVRYFGVGRWAGRECEISYNPLLMVELWEALATRHTHLLTYSMQHRFEIPPACAWVNYVRSHDDIGWGFADEDAEEVGIHGFHHRQFLNRFYTGQEEGSFAVGYPFQFNPKNLDMRISGTTASLAGLEKALAEDNPQAIELAIRRIVLIYSVVMSIGGIPLIYLGDEIGQLNDYGYRDDPGKASDSRWVHRPPMDWERAAQRHDPATIPGRIFRSLSRLIEVRKQQPAFGAATRTEILSTGNPHLFAYLKAADPSRVLIVCNFSEEDQDIPFDRLPAFPPDPCHDLVTGRTVEAGKGATLGPYEFLWLSLPGEA